MKTITISDTFTRPTDTNQYADGDLVADNTTAGNVTPLVLNVGDGGGFITNLRLAKSDETDVTSASFSVHFFGSSPTVANGDNGAISFDNAEYLGKVSFNAMVAATDDAYATARYGDSIFPGGLFVGYPVVYALIESDSTYTPANAETFTLTATFVV